MALQVLSVKRLERGGNVETVELEAQVYGAFIADTVLTALLAKGADSVFHLQAPGDTLARYPALVYSTISDVPALMGDDVEAAHRVTVRIHIITFDGRYGDIYRQAHRIMEGLGFARVQTTPYVEDGQRILIADYRIGVDSTWQQ